VRAGAARYEVLRHDAAGIVGRGPVVAHHRLLHGTPAGRLPLKRWRGRGERQAGAVVAVVERGRRQQGQFGRRRQWRRRGRGQRFQVHSVWRRRLGRRPKVPVSGTGGHAVVPVVMVGRLPSAVVRVKRCGRNRTAAAVVVFAAATAASATAVHRTGHGAHDHAGVLAVLVLVLRPQPPPAAAPPAVARHGGQFVLEQLETHGHHGHADQYVTGRHEHGHVLGGLDAAGHQVAETDGAQAGETEIGALQQRPPLELLVDERAQRHVRRDHGQRQQHGNAFLSVAAVATRRAGGRGVSVGGRARDGFELVPMTVIVTAAHVIAGHRVGRRTLAAAGSALSAAPVVPVTPVAGRTAQSRVDAPKVLGQRLAHRGQVQQHERYADQRVHDRHHPAPHRLRRHVPVTCNTDGDNQSCVFA